MMGMNIYVLEMGWRGRASGGGEEVDIMRRLAGEIWWLGVRRGLGLGGEGEG